MPPQKLPDGFVELFAPAGSIRLNQDRVRNGGHADRIYIQCDVSVTTQPLGINPQTEEFLIQGRRQRTLVHRSLVIITDYNLAQQVEQLTSGATSKTSPPSS